MPPSSGRQSSTNRPPNEIDIDTDSNSNSNFNTNQNVISRSSQPLQRPSSTSTSTSNSPAPQNTSQIPTSPPLQHGYYSPSHSYSHSHLHQHSHTHPGMHGMTMGMIQSVPPPGAAGAAVPMSIGPIPGAPFYYHHPYPLYSPHTHSPSHGHHGPPPPHPPAPPAPPRTGRSNSSGNNPGTPVSSGVDESTRSRFNTASTASSSRTPLQLQSSFPASDDTTRPQLVPTFSYYRNQTNYDKQHYDLLGRPSQSEVRRKGKQNPSLDHQAGFRNDNEDGGGGGEGDDGDEDDDNNNDNDDDMGEYDEPMPMDTMDDLGIGLDLDPALVPASSVVPSSSSSSDPNTIFHRTEKRGNHEYYPSPHHQAHFRELMMANPSTPLSDPPISLNSLVDSEPGKKPAYPLPTIIRCAILGSPRQQLTLSELYLAMQRRFSYYTIGDGKSWRNSVRHNLSLNNLFQKVMRPITEPGKGCYWVVAHDKPPGNKRERKRNKKLGKRALAALEREKAAAAANATATFAGDGSGDDDEGDDDEDDDNSGGIEKPSSSSGLSRRGKATPSRLSTPNTAPFPPYPPTSQVATTSPTVLASTTTTTTTGRPLFPFSRGTVAPNEGSYAAVTGIIPMPSQVPLPPNFGARGYNTNTEFGTNTTTATSPGTGPFSAFATTANTMTPFGASAGFQNSPYNGNTNPPTTVISTWGVNRTSSSSATANNSASRGKKNKSSSMNSKVVPIPTSSERGGKERGVTMTQRSSTQNQDSGSGSMNLSQTGSSQELGSVSETTLTQATSIQPFQSQELGRVSTPLLSRTVSPHPSSLFPLHSTTTTTTPFLRQQPLSAQSSFSSTGTSVPESVSSSEQQQPNRQGFSSHVTTTRQNPTRRRFDSGGSGSTTFTSPSISNPSLPLTLNTPNRPRDTFNTLAAQIASDFQTPDDNTITAGVRTRPISNLTSRSRTGPDSRFTTTRPPRKKRATLRRESGSDDGSGSGRSQEEDEDVEESDDDDGDEYVPSGPGRRSGRRR